MKRCFAWSVLALLLSAMPAVAAVPRTMSYQGVLTDGTGNIVPDGNYSITFRLYDHPTLGGANLLWTEIHDGAGPNPPAVAVGKGGFSVILGSVVTLPVFNSPLWLEIQVAPNPPVTPRTALTASPYSLNARNIYDGGSSGFVGVGRPNQVTAQEFFGVLAPVTSGYGGMYILTQGVNTSPFYGYYTGTDYGWTYLNGADPNKPWILNTFNVDRLAVTNAGNVGIGTTNPGTKLEVNGATKLGSDAPAIKVMKFTGTTAAAQGDIVAVATGLDATKILSISVMVEYGGVAGYYVPPSYTVNTGFEFSWYTNGATGTLYIWNKAGNSAGILSKPFKAMITYEE